MGLERRGVGDRSAWDVIRGRRPWGVLALVMLTGLAMMRNGSDVSSGPPQPAGAVSAERGRTAAAPTPSAGLRPLAYAPASRVRIETLKVDAPVVDVGLDDEGWISAPPPQDPNLAGWYQNGISPGQPGTSVIVGHVDNESGPAVFYSLGTLKPGDRVEVTRYDGRVAVFQVYGVEVYAKEEFPGVRVYGDTGHPELRVITCGGEYSRAGGYDGNVVVFARLVATR
ncbi:class F sortase [Streptomyces somaliensis DSM 40738]|uniref:Class F sortase n=1 Tax=Streptomyces somaliensis (strain ATCC 33201 / DSM 40738 / JCM 12659 / KCTC 9044 / NCTC 11332 / NRRL B-12077 / IP 733) TaxID=1134445 RepID=A0AA44DGA1_STRE0|nr:class F sortase [Streptomyces somaliensis]MCQ0025493.1 class F sortase [Streptomyces somaliensis DSM 40738]NKY15740.1 class F sortase [Streptomyces somaliensis DSM 40738]